MIRFLEQLIAAIWNGLRSRRREARSESGSLDLGYRVSDEVVTKRHVTLTSRERMRHLLILGKTGSGKSYLLRHMSEQDIQRDRGLIYFDLHGDATPFLLRSQCPRTARAPSLEWEAHCHRPFRPHHVGGIESARSGIA